MYGTRVLNQNEDNTGVLDENFLIEAFIRADIGALPEAQVKEFLESEECAGLQEAGVVGRQTIVRLNKVDDLTRRIKIAAFQLAKEKDDPLWGMLVKNRIRERELISKLVQKYGNKAAMSAKAAQRQFLKVMPNAYTRPIKLS